MERSGVANMVNRNPIIRTDKWSLNPTDEQRVLFAETVRIYRRLCRHLMGVVFTHWPELGSLNSQQVIPAVERLVHSTSQNPNVKYPIDRTFHKFPSYYRRAAIAFAVGQVSSFVTRYQEWQSGTRNRREAKPPTLSAEAGCYPALYRGQSPALIFNQQACHLSVPFECHPEKRQPDTNVVAVDLGINTTATVSVVTFDGTVIWREFIHLGRDIDRRDKRLKSVSTKARKTMGKGGTLHKGFCSHTYRKCRNINQNIAHHVSKRITDIAKQFNTQAIVFENLKGWKPSGGKKGSTLRQRLHGWLKAMIRNFTEQKWQEVGGKVIDVIAAYTSKLAYDGSGVVKRDAKNYALATFTSGKRYNCDLNGSQNIAARGILKLTCRKDSEEYSGKSSRYSPRSWACLCDLWTLNPQISTDTTTSRQQVV
jgi:IS605 OrfB family transposase